MDKVKNIEIVDKLEAAILAQPQIECPIVHTFTPGLYLREMTVSAGTLLTSMIHKTEHPFIVSKGHLRVWIDGEIEEIKAPHQGITKPGTRRIIYTLEDSVWTTMHVLVKEGETPEEIEERIIEKHDNIFIDKSKETEALCHL